MLVVNVASKCGFTPQYEGSDDLHGISRPRPHLIGVPSVSSLAGACKELEIAAFCRVNYSVSFPMTEKTHVKGSKAHPFYRWMREQLGRAAHPAWNFHKLLVGKQGQPLAAFKSSVEPESPALKQAIETAL
jgi:glutathione peroxidase